MFTGIVDHFGTIARISKTDNGLRLAVQCRFDDIGIGESISIDGACMTALHPSAGYFECDVSPESCGRTIMNSYQVGTKVNLERPLRLSDRLGGHLVTGHIDQVAKILKTHRYSDFMAMEITGVDSAQQDLLTEKGSVAVNGVSLTVNRVIPGGFDVMIIPHTLERTNLGTLAESDTVNLEFDWMAKMILGYLRKHPLLEKQP